MHADFKSPFPHDKNREIKIVVGVDLFMVLSFPLLSLLSYYNCFQDARMLFWEAKKSSYGRISNRCFLD